MQHTSEWSALKNQLGGWIAVHSVLMVVTGLVFGYAVVRVGVLPHWTGVLLMLGLLSWSWQALFRMWFRPGRPLFATSRLRAWARRCSV